VVCHATTGPPIISPIMAAVDGPQTTRGALVGLARPSKVLYLDPPYHSWSPMLTIAGPSMAPRISCSTLLQLFPPQLDNQMDLCSTIIATVGLLQLYSFANISSKSCPFVATLFSLKSSSILLKKW